MAEERLTLESITPKIDDMARGLRDRIRPWEEEEEKKKAEEERLKHRNPNVPEPDTPEEKECMAEPLPNKPIERLPRPDIVGQGKHYWHCWAAASSSWLQAVYGEVKSRESFIRQYKNAPEGGLDAVRQDHAGRWGRTDQFRRLLTDLRMNAKQLPPQGLTAELVARRLRCHGHLLLFYNTKSARDQRPGQATGPAHTVVVWGITYPHGGYPIKLKLMDPEGHGDYIEKPLDEFQDRVALILAWPKGVVKMSTPGNP